jgi:hypothetical protein
MKSERKKYQIYRERKVLSLLGFIVINGETNDFVWTGKFFTLVTIREQKHRVRYTEYDSGWSYQEYWGKWQTQWVYKRVL